MTPRAPRCILAAAVAVAAYSGPNQDDGNPRHVEQRTAAQCAEEIALLNEARFEASVRAIEAQRHGALHVTDFAVDASCTEAVEADTDRCLREADEVAAAEQPPAANRPGTPAVTPDPSRAPAHDPAPDAFDPYDLLGELDGFPAECDWAVLDALTGRSATGRVR
ncbi:hypothetical protein [Streptomyces indicus]|uniref:Uncharacterized protein n=1 Tax=Streptomyces indicus TaxID=417292 RepID=A0A1G8XVJ2_9ACTN|nr:hypothetical protein [Streptomyces indicus]SDJ94652.1 hypothetical protein SAMN05421806_103434 [Streptomyces indicus]